MHNIQLFSKIMETDQPIIENTLPFLDETILNTMLKERKETALKKVLSFSQVHITPHQGPHLEPHHKKPHLVSVSWRIRGRYLSNRIQILGSSFSVTLQQRSYIFLVVMWFTGCIWFHLNAFLHIFVAD